MEKKWTIGINLYGIWALLYGCFGIYSAIWAVNVLTNVSLFDAIASMPFGFGIYYILAGIFVLIRLNHRVPLVFSLSNLAFMCIINYFAVIKVGPSKVLIGWWGILWIIMTVIIPLSSVYFFTRPKVKEQFNDKKMQEV